MLVIILTVCRLKTSTHTNTINPEEEKSNNQFAGNEYASQGGGIRCNGTVTLQYIASKRYPDYT